MTLEQWDAWLTPAFLQQRYPHISAHTGYQPTTGILIFLMRSPEYDKFPVSGHSDHNQPLATSADIIINKNFVRFTATCIEVAEKYLELVDIWYNRYYTKEPEPAL